MDQTLSFIDDKFSWHTALALALCAKEAYKTPEEMQETILNEWGYEKFIFISQADTQLFIAIKADRVIISFRGTENLNDWITDIKIGWSNVFKYGQTHSGFHNAYTVVGDELKKYLAAQDMNGKKIWVTGHSLGAALASICIADLQSLYGSQIMGCYTYGQPRTGDTVFANFIATKYANHLFRITNDTDIVTRLPPSYSHVGSLYHFDRAGNLESSPNPNAPSLTLSSANRSADTLEPPPLNDEEFAKLQEALANPEAGTLGLLDYLPSISNHFMESYIKKIEDYIDSPLFNIVLD